MQPRWRANAVLLLNRGPGFEHWLMLGDDNRVDDGLELPTALALSVAADAAGDELLAQRIRDLLYELGAADPGLTGHELCSQLEPLLSSGSLRVVERSRELPDVRSDGPMPELHVEAPPIAAPEPVLIDDAPSLQRSVAVVVLDFDGDGEPIVNLPLFINHRRGTIDAGKTDASGKLGIEQLPADHSWSLFSGHNPDT
ncbi:MAG: hypothetical protein R6X02_04860 [Enhygromyxa sp.]